MYACLLSFLTPHHKLTTNFRNNVIIKIFSVPEKSLELKYPPVWYRSERNSKVLCYAEQVYPKPEMRLYLNSSEAENVTLKYQETPSGLFDVEISISSDSLIDGTVILCELHVALTNYTVRKEAIYYEEETVSSSAKIWRTSAAKWIISLIISNLVLVAHLL
uniref:Immunoglobulin V-set domain-containing protein n=1 Tax=Dendroctonus ponderosae TaxID=77166 RepID=A0AAR5PQ15_DENPD